MYENLDSISRRCFTCLILYHISKTVPEDSKLIRSLIKSLSSSPKRQHTIPTSQQFLRISTSYHRTPSKMKLSFAAHVLSLGSIVAVTNADFNGLRRVSTRTANGDSSHRKLLELRDVGGSGPLSACQGDCDDDDDCEVRDNTVADAHCAQTLISPADHISLSPISLSLSPRPASSATNATSLNLSPAALVRAQKRPTTAPFALTTTFSLWAATWALESWDYARATAARIRIAREIWSVSCATTSRQCQDAMAREGGARTTASLTLRRTRDRTLLQTPPLL